MPAEQDQQKPKHKADLSGVAETLLITVYSRAHDAKSANPILNDTTSLRLYESLDYDWSRLGLTPGSFLGVSVRAVYFDGWANDFLSDHKDEDVTVLHLACGLDTRNLRIKYGPRVCWVDVDLPPVIELRRRLVDQGLLPSPSQGDYRLLGASVTEDGWLDGIPNDRPTLILFEGLAMYLTAEDGTAMVKRLVSNFPCGQLGFDCVGWLFTSSSKLAKFVRTTGANFKWALDHPKALETLVPGYDVKLSESTSQLDLPGVDLFPTLLRLVTRFMSFIPIVRDSSRVVLYDFDAEEGPGS